MGKLLVILGSHPNLSVAELKAVFGQTAVKILHPQVAEVELPTKLLVRKHNSLLAELGGSTKLLQPVKTFPPNCSRKELLEAAGQHVLSLKKDKITFGLGSYGVAEKVRLDGMQLKALLNKNHQRARWIKGPTTGLSAAVQLHHPEFVEFIQIKTKTNICLTQTLAVQNIDDWTLRDRGKPYADHKKGMLPPKVARIMVNLALGSLSGRDFTQTTLLDPFCGSGTVLIEAGSAGVTQLIGVDIDSLAARGTQKNLSWFARTSKLTYSHQIFTADATHLSALLPRGSVTHLVTEPFLGKQTPQTSQVPNIVKGLEKLYLGALKNWVSILADGAKIVMVVPLFSHSALTTATGFKSLFDRVSSLGYYKVTAEPLIYSRPQATVQRQIWQLEKITPLPNR